MMMMMTTDLLERSGFPLRSSAPASTSTSTHFCCISCLHRRCIYDVEIAVCETLDQSVDSFASGVTRAGDTRGGN